MDVKDKLVTVEELGEAIVQKTAYVRAASAQGGNYAVVGNIFNVYFVQVFYQGYVGHAIIPKSLFPTTERIVSCMIGADQGYCEIGYYRDDNYAYMRCRSFVFAGTDCIADVQTDIIVI